MVLAGDAPRLLLSPDRGRRVQFHRGLRPLDPRGKELRIQDLERPGDPEAVVFAPVV